MMDPLVSVICVCYNHAPFVVAALDSVVAQTYPNIELIIVDDGSLDRSANVIAEWCARNPSTQFLDLKTNHGYCRAFNKGLANAKGEFYIDLAADDVLLPDRVAKGVQGFLEKGERYAIQFGDAEYINTEGQVIKKHSDRFPHHTIPHDQVYSDVIHRYFICSPTMMVRKSVLDAMGCYDERLNYEDFDLWVRAARDYLFFYVPDVLVQKRIVSGSLGQQQYSRNSNQMQSTYLVCLKILGMNRTRKESRVLTKRILYELKWNLRFFHWRLAVKYLGLLVRNVCK
jgi:glycosyltransferase involved in cell wall biosynthesis